MLRSSLLTLLASGLPMPVLWLQPCSGADIKAIMGQALGMAVAEAEVRVGANVDGAQPTACVTVTIRHVTEAASRLRTLAM